MSVIDCSALRMEKVGDCQMWERRLTVRQEAMMRLGSNDTSLSKCNREMLGLDKFIEVNPQLPDEYLTGKEMSFDPSYER